MPTTPITSEVTVVGVWISQDRICIPTIAQDPHDCNAHQHLPGTKQVRVDVVPHTSGDDEREALVALVGKRCRLVVVG